MMKESEISNGSKAYLAFVVTLFMAALVSCTSRDKEDSELVTPPKPLYLKPVVTIKPATDVTITTAKIEAEVVPNEDGTMVSFEYKNSTDGTWSEKNLPTTFSGKNNQKVTFDLSDLKANTEYNFRVKALNKGGTSLSSDEKFITYAVSDFDGNLYHTIIIWPQTWLKENFRGTHYANGDPIPNVTDSAAWRQLTTGAYCWYNNNAELGKTYGGLYNWYVASDPRGLIAGWHTPASSDWGALNSFLGGYYPAGPALMAVTGWSSPSRKPTNSSGFTALPNGAFLPSNGKFIFSNLGEDAVYWHRDPFGPGACASEISNQNCWFSIGYIYKFNLGFAIRLLKD
jgi:uncharacterized protein (TIGR02145 family)